MIDCAAGEMGLIFLDDQLQPLSRVGCCVCGHAIPEPLVQQVTNCALGAIEMCGNPECLGFIRFVRTGPDRFALQLGLIL